MKKIPARPRKFVKNIPLRCPHLTIALGFTALTGIGCCVDPPNKLTQLRDAYRSGATALDLDGDGRAEWSIERVGGVVTRETIDHDGDGKPEVILELNGSLQRLQVGTWELAAPYRMTTLSDRNYDGIFDRRIVMAPLAADSTKARWTVEGDPDQDDGFCIDATCVNGTCMSRDRSAEICPPIDQCHELPKCDNATAECRGGDVKQCPAPICRIASCDPATGCKTEPAPDETCCPLSDFQGLCCTGSCIDPRSDNRNCGNCGVTCSGGQVCHAATASPTVMPASCSRGWPSTRWTACANAPPEGRLRRSLRHDERRHDPQRQHRVLGRRQLVLPRPRA